MKESYRTLVKRYMYTDNDYFIVKGLHAGIIRAINYNFIGEDGKLNQPLNGIEMFCSKNANTVEDIIKRINDKIDFDEYIIEHDVDTSDMRKLARAYRDFYKRHEREEAKAVQERGMNI